MADAVVFGEEEIRRGWMTLHAVHTGPRVFVGNDAVVPPGTVIPEDVSTGGVGEATEGKLVRVTGRVTQTFQDDAPYGYTLYVNDGSGEVQIFVHLFPGVPASTLRALTTAQTIQVTGLSAQYESTY